MVGNQTQTLAKHCTTKLLHPQLSIIIILIIQRISYVHGTARHIFYAFSKNPSISDIIVFLYRESITKNAISSTMSPRQKAFLLAGEGYTIFLFYLLEIIFCCCFSCCYQEQNCDSLLTASGSKRKHQPQRWKVRTSNQRKEGNEEEDVREANK